MHAEWMIEHAWIVPALPLLSFVIVGLFVRPYAERFAGVVAASSVVLAALCSYRIAYEYLHAYPGADHHPALIPWSIEWLRYAPGMSVNAGVLLDPISILLLIVVTTVSALVHIYSLGYMKGENGYGRYFTFLNLFTFSMLGLVLAPNIVQMYVCWELVGASSFLLIGFYYTKPSAVAAAKKAFIVTRFADLGFLLGVLVLGYWGFTLFPSWSSEMRNAGIAGVQPFDFAYLTDPAFLRKMAAFPTVFFGMHMLTLSMMLVYMGAAGKSAMFPLHIWLPDAMEGPTPVSALIHAATMVVAGVYLVARLFPAFAYSGTAALGVAYVGGFTSLFAALIAITQDDIKRVLAYSTLSQLGYMMLALGVSTMDHSLGYTASMFHLFTHAFFKALLFLGAGSVIHAVHTNSIWEMGGLAKRMKVTHLCFLVATLAISGIWPFAGFFSKDEILAATLLNHHYVLFGIAFLVAGLTAFYMFRIYLVTFWGPERSERAGHAHESPALMLVPMLILMVLSATTGFVPMGTFVNIGEHEAHHGINLAIAVPVSAFALLGIGFAIFLYRGNASAASALAQRMSGVYKVLRGAFFIDAIYLFITHKIIFRYFARFVAWFDRAAVDGSMNLTGWLTMRSGFWLSVLQTGQVQTYGLWFTGGATFVLFILWCAFL